MAPPTTGRRLRRAGLLSLAALATSVALLVALPAPAAHAAPTTQSLSAQVAQAERDLTAVVEQYNLATVSLQRTQQQIDQTTSQLGSLDTQAAQESRTVASVATAAYEGTAGGSVSVLMVAGSPQTLVGQLTALNQLAHGRTAAVTALTATTAKLHAQKQRLATLHAAQVAQRQDLAARKQKIQAQIAALERQAPASVRNASGPVTSTAAPYVAGRAAKVVKYAFAQLGKPYVFGAAGPSTFDCSGLTMAAWAQVGVHLTHASSIQMTQETRRISYSQLQPGDLVFFEAGNHVGIYIGSGEVIEAPHTGDVVKIATIAWMGGYYALGRPF